MLTVGSFEEFELKTTREEDNLILIRQDGRQRYFPQVSVAAGTTGLHVYTLYLLGILTP
jgi:hypothetical protein